MLTLKVNGEFITWPEKFALLMMKYYENNGVPYTVHKNCADAGSDC